MSDQTNINVWIRSEDVDHPKLERLRRAVVASVGQEDDVTQPWVVWGSGVSRAWLFGKLEAGAQVLIFPPWAQGGFAGLPAIRTSDAPSALLWLESEHYSVGASSAIEPTPAWQECGLFEGTKRAWLVAHEPFVGAGRAWLCTAELLISTPTSRPIEVRRLTRDVLTFIGNGCKKPKSPAAVSGNSPELSGFTAVDVPYLLAFLGIPGPKDVTQTARFVNRRLGLQPDIEIVERLLARPEVQGELQKPIGKRAQLAKVVDDFGMRSFRLELEETAS